MGSTGSNPVGGTMYRYCEHCDACYEFEESFTIVLRINSEGWTEAIQVCPDCNEIYECLEVTEW